MNRQLAAVLVSAAALMASPCIAAPRPITIAEAESIVRATVEQDDPEAKSPPGYEIDDHFKARGAANFIIFSVIWMGAPDGGAEVGSYEVNMRTGDVFSALFCKEYKGPGIARAQATVRKAIGLDAAAYRKYRSGGEYC